MLGIHDNKKESERVIIDCLEDGTFDITVGDSNSVKFSRGDCEYWNIDDLTKKLYPIKILTRIRSESE